MNINRNNYEEYFLLYIDNELSVAEKNMVEAFVASNPDLGEELVMLQQSIVKPGTVEFFDKKSLLKPLPVDKAIEEKLLLLLDNELPENDKKEILLLAATDKSVKEEWELLQQTKLTNTDEIIFEEKPLLYRKETKIIPVAWWRMAAAAMLIGFGLWGTVSYINRNERIKISETETAGISIPKEESTVNKTNDTSLPVIANITPDAIAGNETTAGKITVVKSTNEKNATQKTTVLKNTDNNIASAKEEDDDKVTHDDLENINNDRSNQKIFANVSPETNITKPANNVEIIASPKNEYATTASFNNADKQEEYASFDEDNDKPKRTKLGGFFKKVKRQFERKTKIKTGSDDEVRIANMSFAIH